MGEIIVPKHRELSIRHEGPAEGLVKDGSIVFAGGKAYAPLTKSVRVHVSGARVQLFDSAPDSHGELLLDLPWKAAKLLSGEMKKMAIEKTGGVIQVIEGGTPLVEIPVNIGFRLAKVIRAQAAQAEQNDKVLKVIQDQALLIRSGFPVALTRNPVFKEAGKEAAWDTDLRRFLPGGVPSGSTFGHPGLYDKPRNVHRIGASSVPSAETSGNRRALAGGSHGASPRRDRLRRRGRFAKTEGRHPLLEESNLALETKQGETVEVEKAGPRD